MFKPIPFERGRVVRSTQGRDRNRCFIVMQLIGQVNSIGDSGYVVVCDGATRRLDHLKKKKIKHLKALPLRMDALDTLAQQNCLKDSDIRSFLEANGYGLKKEPLCKED
jgi:hypothetical protein